MKVIAITPNQKTDTLASFIISGLYDLGVEVIATDYGNGVQNVYSDGEVIEHSKDADYVFAFWGKHGRNGVPSPKYHLLDIINKPEITAYLDGSEWTSTGYEDTPTQCKDSILDPKRIKGEPWINEELYDKSKLYFKRVVLEEDLERDKIVPCYIGAHNSYFVNEDVNLQAKTYDFYCSFGGSAGHVGTGLRSVVYDHCKSLIGYNSIVGQKLDNKDYLNTILNSYIAISAWGAGNCCRRMWEILANRTCCFIQKPFIIYPNKFVDGESCVYYETIDEFKEKLNYYLNNQEECITIGKNGFDHVKKYHTATKRVQYIFDNMKK